MRDRGPKGTVLRVGVFPRGGRDVEPRAVHDLAHVDLREEVAQGENENDAITFCQTLIEIQILVENLMQPV